MMITTTAEQIRVGNAARKVGGYRELLRLDRERRKIGLHNKAILKYDAESKKYYYVKHSPELENECIKMPNSLTNRMYGVNEIIPRQVKAFGVEDGSLAHYYCELKPEVLSWLGNNLTVQLNGYRCWVKFELISQSGKLSSFGCIPFITFKHINDAVAFKLKWC